MDTAAELGEDQQDDVVASVVFLEVVVEVGNRVGRLRPQAGVVGQLASVGVEAVVRSGGVEHAGSEAGQVRLRDVAHVLGHGVVAVLNGRGVHGGSGAQDVGAFQGVQAGLGEVVQHRALAQHGRVDA